MLNATTSILSITAVSQVVDFGDTDLNYTLARFNNCTEGGILDICTFCKVLRCDIRFTPPLPSLPFFPLFFLFFFLLSCWFIDVWGHLNAHFNSGWLTNQPRFTAIRFDINDQHNVIVTAPGEPLLELGWWIRNGFSLPLPSSSSPPLPPPFPSPFSPPLSSHYFFAISTNDWRQILWPWDSTPPSCSGIVCTRGGEGRGGERRGEEGWGGVRRGEDGWGGVRRWGKPN